MPSHARASRVSSFDLRRKLENMRLVFFDDLTAPVEDEVKLPEGVQLPMWAGKSESEDESV